MMNGEDAKRKKRMVVIGVSSFLLVAMVIAVTVGVGINVKDDNDDDDLNDSQKRTTKSISESKKAIQAICQPTDYTKTCEDTLTKNAGNTTDPRELIKTVFTIGQKYVKEAANKSMTLKELYNDTRTRGALLACKQLMDMSVNELKSSFSKMGEFEVAKMDDLMEDIQIWLSAAVTYQETCMDGFQNASTDAANKMKVALKSSREITINALDIVSGLSSVLSSLQFSAYSRRLLQENDNTVPFELANGDPINFPRWTDPHGRKLLSSSPGEIKPNITVAKDGSGDCKTVAEAVRKIPKKGNDTYVIYVKQGLYKEYIEVNVAPVRILLIGDGADKTRITGNKNFKDGVGTMMTSTFAIKTDRFMAKNIAFENSAGAIKEQAVALRASGDFAIFYNCTMDGYQDTLYAHAKRQFYRDCTITGTIDFVFGDAAAVFQNCTFLVRMPLKYQQNAITAHGRTQRRQPSGFIIQNSTITAHPEFYADRLKYKSYLGRPWKPFSRTIIMESYIDDFIDPEGWARWTGEVGLKTCWYSEYNNYGPGANLTSRVKWIGVKSIDRKKALQYTAARFIRGDEWIKPTGIPYFPLLTTRH